MPGCERLHASRARMCAVAAAVALAAARLDAAQETWNLDSLSNIGGHATSVVGAPAVVATPFGNGLRFNGNDGLIVDVNPVAGAAAFTIEMLLRPDVNDNAVLDEPRILHIQSNAPNDHRAILEGRVAGDQWYLDAFLRAPSAANPNVIANLTLIDASKTHPVNRWYAYALVYDGAEMRVYLNGALEFAGDLAIGPLAAGQTSIGMRHNQIRYFSGDIAQVRFSTTALAVDQLLSGRIPGDYDGSFYAPGGGIDASDLDVWRTQYGHVGALPRVGDNADGDQDGDVDGDDFLFWQRRVGLDPPPATGQVPEPQALPLIAIAVAAWQARVCHPSPLRTCRR